MPLHRLILRALALSLTGLLGAMPPPDPGMVEGYRRDGSLPARLAFAQRLGNHRVDPDLLAAAQARLQRRMDPASQLLPTPPPAWKGMPTKGAVKLFVLLVDFSDYPHSEALNTTGLVQGRVFGNGDSAAAFPYESLSNYYRRASLNQLELSGSVLGWYRPGYSRAAMAQTTAGREGLIKEALLYFQSQGHAFAQYDNQGSGAIDYFAVVWSGPDNGWSNFWWGYQTEFSDPSFKVGGKRLGKYSWQWESRPAGGAYVPRTLIHETGHALGLPDYYDYDTTVGPNGGIGDLDMMDGNWGDHNCFSKFLLDWITPQVVTGTTLGLALTPAENAPGDAVIVVPPDAASGTAFGEYFMVQNRRQLQNDLTYPTSGLLIWHVDSRLDPATGNADYLYDNSFTEHKLLKLMEADGLEQIERSSASAHAGDYYQPGAVFGPATQPASLRYSGLQTWLEVRNIALAGTTMTLDVLAIPPDATAPTGAPTQPTATGNADALNLSWTAGTAADPESGITGYSVQLGTTPGGSDVYNGLTGPVTSRAFPGLGRFEGRPLYARVRAMNGAGLFSGWSPNSLPVVLSLPTVLCSTLDNCQLTFKTVGPWTADATTQVQGGTSARSAGIPDNGTTSLQTWVTGPGTLRFYWKVSSEAGYDYLRFNMDGSPQLAPISGDTAWTQVTLALPAGSHFLEWTYTKDGGANSGSDAAWVDKVDWSGTVPTTPSYDLNADGSIDPRDLLTFARYYGTSSPLADFTGDGTVDDLDLAVLLATL